MKKSKITREEQRIRKWQQEHYDYEQTCELCGGTWNADGTCSECYSIKLKPGDHIKYAPDMISRNGRNATSHVINEIHRYRGRMWTRLSGKKCPVLLCNCLKEEQYQEFYTKNPRTKVDIPDIIDSYIGIHESLLECNQEPAKTKIIGGIESLRELKEVIIENDIADFVPASDLDQLRGENLTLSMRLHKAGKLLMDAQSYINQHGYKPHNKAYGKMMGDIVLFFNEEDATSGNAALPSGINELKREWLKVPGTAGAMVAYDPSSGTETAKTCLENVRHEVERLKKRAGTPLLYVQEFETIITQELEKLDHPVLTFRNGNQMAATQSSDPIKGTGQKVWQETCKEGEKLEKK